MPLKYCVKNDENAIVFESDSKLECEMVAISLAFASIYVGESTFQICKYKRAIDEVDAQSAPQRMREKLQIARFNARIPEQVAPEEIDAYIAYRLSKGNDEEDITKRIRVIAANRERLNVL